MENSLVFELKNSSNLRICLANPRWMSREKCSVPSLSEGSNFRWTSIKGAQTKGKQSRKTESQYEWTVFCEKGFPLRRHQFWKDRESVRAIHLGTLRHIAFSFELLGFVLKDHMHIFLVSVWLMPFQRYPYVIASTDWRLGKQHEPVCVTFLYHEEQHSNEIISKHDFPETLKPKYEGYFWRRKNVKKKKKYLEETEPVRLG